MAKSAFAGWDKLLAVHFDADAVQRKDAGAFGRNANCCENALMIEFGRC